MKELKIQYDVLAIRSLAQDQEERSKNERLRAYYEEAGPDYAAWSPGFNMHFGYYNWTLNPFNRESMLNNMNQKMLDKLDLGRLQNGTIADFGCGLGATLRYAHQQYPQLNYSGITLVPWQVQQAELLNRNEGVSKNIHIIEGDYSQTPYEDNSVDGIWAIESSCYADGANKSNLLREIYRVLRPGGKFVIADGFRKHQRPLNKLVTSAYRQLCHSWALDELGDIGEVSSSLKTIGFKHIDVQNISYRVAPSVAHVPFTVISFLIKELLFGKKKMSEERWNNLKSPLLTMVVGLAQRDFGYYLVSGEKPITNN
ncbi:methyltransferase domain-containing protein [Reichenbachiella sp.]|uniref:SAM-dependent methyltransferase n=1 Tax=Reichenbachiella sp. TaxID=2184521 RepID=UPI00329A1123